MKHYTNYSLTGQSTVFENYRI